MKPEQVNKIDLTEKYALIGRFVVNFENIVQEIRFTLSAIFQIQGLKTWDISKVVFSQKQFTADPLISCLESICYQILKDDADSKELLKSISEFKKRFIKQVEMRNDLLHSTFYLGESENIVSSDIIPENEFYVTKHTAKKEGAVLKIVAETTDDIKKHLDDLDALYEEIFKLKFRIFKTVQKLSEK